MNDFGPKSVFPPVAPVGARCLDCDYLLDKLPEARCPECGRAFSAWNPRTYSTGGMFPRWARMLQHPPGLLLVLALVPVGFTLWAFRRPGGAFDGQVGGFFFATLIGLVYALRAVACFTVTAAYRRPGSPFRKHPFRWAAVPCLLVLWFAVAVAACDAVERFAFDRSRSSLEAIARRAQLPTTTERAGLLSVLRADRYAGGVLLLMGSGYDAGACGYAYFPDLDPVGQSFGSVRLEFRHVTGRWWSYWDGSEPRYAGRGTAPPWGVGASSQPAR